MTVYFTNCLDKQSLVVIERTLELVTSPKTQTQPQSIVSVTSGKPLNPFESQFSYLRKGNDCT